MWSASVGKLKKVCACAICYTHRKRERESPHLKREYIVEVDISQTNSLQFYIPQRSVLAESGMMESCHLWVKSLAAVLL